MPEFTQAEREIIRLALRNWDGWVDSKRQSITHEQDDLRWDLLERITP